MASTPGAARSRRGVEVDELPADLGQTCPQAGGRRHLHHRSAAGRPVAVTPAASPSERNTDVAACYSQETDRGGKLALGVPGHGGRQRVHRSRSIVLACGALLIAATAGVVQLSSARLCPQAPATLSHDSQCGAPQASGGSRASVARAVAGNVQGSWNAPVRGLVGRAGDALFPVSGGSNVPGLDILDVQLRLNPSANTLTVTQHIVDLLHPELTAAETGGRDYQEYVTRWRIGTTVYFAAMENSTQGRPAFFAGKPESAGSCSVPTCDLRSLAFPEPGLQRDPAGLDVRVEHGLFMCPGSPSANQPCALSIVVKLGDIGGPGVTSLLSDVGSYSFTSSHPAGYVAAGNILTQQTSLPLRIDAVCCFNYQASA
jgi:hypothetical protein